MRSIKLEELTEEQRKLLDAAEKAMGNAYSPYSGFSVGAAILTDDDHIITGSNVENASYSESLCAERSALARANAIGKRIYRSIAVIAKHMDYNTIQVSAPCGSCRQMMHEASSVSGSDLEIIMSNTDKSRIIISTISELLPLAFGPEDMGDDVGKYRG